MRKPCLDCGEVSEESRCEAHRRDDDNARRRYGGWDGESARRAAQGLQSATSRGYDAAWRRLSKRVRHLQPFCGECGTWGTVGNPLTVDHTPEAWERRRKGLQIRLQDVRVLCRSCNSAAGAARSLSKDSA